MKKTLYILLALAFMALMGLGLAGLAYYVVFLVPNVQTGGGEAVLYVPTGAGYAQLRDSLESRALLRRPRTFAWAAEWEKLPARVKPGRYVLRNDMGNKALVRMLVLGRQSEVRLTLSGNVHSLERLAGKLSASVEVDSVQMLEALRDVRLRDSLGFGAETYMAMFLPNTYRLWWTASPVEILRRFKKEYEAFWNEERRAKAFEIGFTPLQVSTLASIVAGETNQVPEMPRVAGVYMNRLRIGMPLQADPTLKFAVGDFGLRRILNVHKEVDSPYNTYKYAGLPPGPISVPPVAAIEAVLHYEHHGYFYFCAKEDFSGFHNFAADLAAHNRNAARYHAALNRAGIR